MKRNTFLLTVVLVICTQTVGAQVVGKWNCGSSGNNVTATLIDNTLTISGVGDMANYNDYNTPWHSHKSSITKLVIEEGVTSIGTNAFNGVGLTSAVISVSVTSIGYYAFFGCDGLTSITIPNSVTTIGTFAFRGCSGLTSVIIGNSVTSIQDYAFYGCTGLTSITIPNSVTTIVNNAFANCSGLTSITIPNSVTTIGNNAFTNCSGLTSITIPNSVTTIGNNAFEGCSGLTSVIIGNSVTSIQDYAFANCSGLTSITIPNSVTTIGNNAFTNCSGLTSITIPNSVATIGTSAFRGCSGLTSVIIGNSVTSMGSSAFSGCVGLISVTILNGAASIGAYAFSDCTGLTSIKIPASMISIRSAAFRNCISLTSVTIPDSVTSIGNQTFDGCVSLASVIIGNSVTTIGNNAFTNCSGLTSVTIPNSVISIGFGAFHGCTSLASVAISNSVTSIGSEAFRGCSGLTSITIPSNVISIGQQPFYQCTNLSSIVILNAAPPAIIVNQSFGGVDKTDACLYVPSGSTTAYGLADYWGKFACVNPTTGYVATITFNSEGGGSVSPQTLLIGGKAVKPTPNRYGYLFAGWYKDNEFKEAWDFDTDVIEDITLYAKWDVIPTHTVTWNANGGIPAPKQVTVNQGDEVSEPDLMTKTGYAFGGWYKDNECIEEWNLGIDIVEDDITLYAKWSVIAVTDISGIPNVIVVGEQVVLTGTVAPSNATNKIIVWSIGNAGTTGAEIYSGGVFVATSTGIAVIKATIADGKTAGVDYEKIFVVDISEKNSILSPNRVIPLPSDQITQNLGVSSANVMSGKFTAGPNPAAKFSGKIGFFWQGKWTQNTTLIIFDAFGNVVNKVAIKDNALNTQSRRMVGSWNLKDTKGRVVSDGVYLVKGIVTTSDGNKEKISLIIEIR